MPIDTEKIHKMPGEISAGESHDSLLNDLIRGLTNLNSSQKTIEFSNEWLLENFCLFGSTYIAIYSGKGRGVEWLSWSPPDLFTSRVHEVDFNNVAINFQKTTRVTLLGYEEMTQINPETTEWVDRNSIHSVMLLPIQFEKDINGIFLLYRTKAEPPFGSEDQRLGQSISALISNLLKWQLRWEEAEKKVQELDQMLRASMSMTESLNLEDVLNAILINALKLLPLVNDAHIFLYEKEKLEFGAALFQDGSTGKAWATPRPGGLTYTVATTAQMIIVEDMCTHPLFADAPDTWCGSIVGIPLMVNHTVLGVMTLAKLTPSAFQPNEIEILGRLAGQAANVIHNVHRHADIALQAFTDPLTGLPNRRSFEWEGKKLIEHAERYQRAFTIAMLDLNGFKRINDTYGHATGDDSLRLLAQCMQNALRKTDFLARFGGDEFVVLFPETAASTAHEVLSNLLQRVMECQVPVRPHKFELLSVSYGLATFPQDGHNLAELTRMADKLLYLTKGQLNSATIS